MHYCQPSPTSPERHTRTTGAYLIKTAPQALHFATDDGIQLRADAWGDPANPPVLLSHGGGQTRHSWGKTAMALAELGWYAISYDHRGHGDSGWSPDGHYHFSRFADDQLAIARQLDRKPAVVGASLGGLSALLAQADGSQYAALILVDITPFMDQQSASNIMQFMQESMDDGFANLDEAAAVIAHYTGRPLRRNTAGLEKNLRLGDDGRYRWHWDPAFMQLEIDALSTTERMGAGALHQDVPLLLIRGQLSDLVTPEIAQRFLAFAPHAEFVDVANARHMVAGDANDIFTTAVVDFLSRHRP